MPGESLPAHLCCSTLLTAADAVVALSAGLLGSLPAPQAGLAGESCPDVRHLTSYPILPRSLPSAAPLGPFFSCEHPQHLVVCTDVSPAPRFFPTAAHAWSFFCCEHPQDQDALIREVQQRFGFRPAVTCYRGRADEPMTYPAGPASGGWVWW